SRPRRVTARSVSSAPYPVSTSAETGRSVACTIRATAWITSYRLRLFPSGRPCAQEIAADEVAMAGAPASSTTRAETGSHALGRTIGSPGTWSRVKVTAFFHGVGSLLILPFNTPRPRQWRPEHLPVRA